MRNSEMILSGLEPVWLHDSSAVICNHILVRFPPYFPNILPLRSLRGKRKKVLIFAGSRRNAGWRGILPGAGADLRRFSEDYPLSERAIDRERMSRDPAPSLCRAASQEALGIGPDCRRLG
jgi:hypothetical protein